MAVSDAGGNTPVMQVYDGAVISYFLAVQKQIGKICTPFLIDRVCSEILFYLIFKHFVGLRVLIIRFPGTDNRTQTTFSIHVFMYGCRTVILSPARQIDSHTPVTIDPVVAMADIFNLRKNL